mmetsp:Transcript_98716/g.169908  ORF Transcript_98716/g.169908 Transcript_98716/m.169908 type:complete len:100 (+) Transcript_98716:761-1060(+)
MMKTRVTADFGATALGLWLAGTDISRRSSLAVHERGVPGDFLKTEAAAAVAAAPPRDAAQNTRVPDPVRLAWLAQYLPKKESRLMNLASRSRLQIAKTD